MCNTKNTKNKSGAQIFATQVEDPSRFGVVQFKDDMEILNIIEKPKFPKSDFAVIGLYVFDARVYEYLSLIKPSDRNELEIIDILNIYLLRDTLSLNIIKNGSVWFDAGTPESLLKASVYVELFERQSGAMIGCIEEAAFEKKFISKTKMMNLIKSMKNSDYKNYLEKLL